MDMHDMVECINLALIKRGSTWRLVSRVYETSGFINGNSVILKCEVTAINGDQKLDKFVEDSIMYVKGSISKDTVLDRLKKKILILLICNIEKL